VKALEGSLPAHADGEIISTDAQELAIEILPQAVELVCPGPALAALPKKKWSRKARRAG